MHRARRDGRRVPLEVLGCFESTAEADAWVRNVASRAVVEDDVLVAPTCEVALERARGRRRVDARASTSAAHHGRREARPDTVRFAFQGVEAEQDALRGAGGEGGALADQAPGRRFADAASP